MRISFNHLLATRNHLCFLLESVLESGRSFAVNALYSHSYTDPSLYKHTYCFGLLTFSSVYYRLSGKVSLWTRFVYNAVLIDYIFSLTTR